MIQPVDPTPASLIEAAYPTPDYRDAFRISVGNDVSVEDFASNFFLAQPRWLAKVSMNLGGRSSRLDAIGTASYDADTSVGSWKVFGRSDNEIMFGDHMGFMEYRFSVLRRDDGDIEAATSVQYLKPFAHVYFTIVKPFHIGFIKMALRNAARSTRRQPTSSGAKS